MNATGRKHLVKGARVRVGVRERVRVSYYRAEWHGEEAPSEGSKDKG